MQNLIVKHNISTTDYQIFKTELYSDIQKAIKILKSHFSVSWDRNKRIFRCGNENAEGKPRTTIFINPEEYEAQNLYKEFCRFAETKQNEAIQIEILSND